jgi:ATP/maltotriose-dependent transcriptional regulator MalT
MGDLDDGRRTENEGLIEPLSPRELEVLQLVTAGRSNREIAAALVISTGTAKTHVHNLCGKLGVRNRTEAATKAIELGLV